MEKQFIVCISREYGSGGHVIAEKIAKDLGVSLYDRNILDEIAEAKETSVDQLEHLDEKPRNPFLSRRVRGFSNSMEENLAEMQFEYLQNKADSGESFVVLGRCSETVLKDREGLVSIFIVGDREVKTARVMEKFQLSKEEADAKTFRHDRLRRQYHNRYSDFKWGDARKYDICINSSRLGLEKTAEILEDYVSKKIEKRD